MGTTSCVRLPCRRANPLVTGNFACLSLHVSDVDSLRAKGRPAVDRPADQGKGKLADGPGRDQALMSDEQQPIAIPPEDLDVGRPA